MILIVILSVIALFNGAVIATDMTSCDNGIDLPYQVSVPNCDQPPCTIVRGETLVVTIDFFSPHYIDVLTPEAVAIVLGLEVNYPLPNQDGCSTLANTQCPLEEGEYTSYVFNMNVLAIFPKISLAINFTLYDQDKKGVACFQVACQIA